MAKKIDDRSFDPKNTEHANFQPKKKCAPPVMYTRSTPLGIFCFNSFYVLIQVILNVDHLSVIILFNYNDFTALDRIFFSLRPKL